MEIILNKQQRRAKELSDKLQSDMQSAREKANGTQDPVDEKKAVRLEVLSAKALRTYTKSVKRCRGSYRKGTACGHCERCKDRKFDYKKKDEAMKAEKERTKDFPSDRVKRHQEVKIK